MFSRLTHRRLALALIVASSTLAAYAQPSLSTDEHTLPARLDQTGLYLPGTRVVAAGNLPYSPQYALWSDGAVKRRWIYLPPDTSIDGSNPNAWEFPVGTRLWKQFGYGQPIETRYIERLADGSWRYASYVWNPDGTEATLAPATGIRSLPIGDAPAGTYAIPSQDDCRACHEGGRVAVLGFSALQLAVDRDPNAPHAEPRQAGDVELDQLQRLGLLANSPSRSSGGPLQAPVARAALGYLHANCGQCHNADGPLSDIGLDLSLQDGNRAPAAATTIGKRADTTVDGLDVRIVAGRPADSQLLARMKSRNPYNQMPPLGTNLVDTEAVALIEQWIQQHDTRGGQTDEQDDQ